MAIRGSLSHRTGSAISIDDIISEIRSERDTLIQNKESKISKVSEMLDVDTFEIPSEWKWVALGDLCILLSRGKSPTYSEVKKYPVFAQKCNQPQHLALEKALFLDETTLDKWPEYFKLRDADVVINSTGTGTVGRVGYFTSESLDSRYEFIVPDSHVTVVRVGNNVISKYIYYALRTKSIQTIMERTFRGSTNQKEFYIDSVYSIPIPLPPTEEQKEIVSILDKVYEQLDIIDTLQLKYESDLSVLKSKIIDAGIRGKLTEQLPEDGTAEDLYELIKEEKEKLIKEGKIKTEKPLPAIDADDTPFEIPKNWKWVRMSDVLDIRDGTHDSPQYQKEGVPLVTSKNLSTGILDYENVKYISQEDADAINARSRVSDGDILFAMIGTIGNPVLVKKEIDFCIKNVALFKSIAKEKLSMEYVYTFLLAEQYEFRRIVSGGLQPFISLKQFREHLIPLPPISEQKRIVDKIDKVLDAIS